MKVSLRELSLAMVAACYLPVGVLAAFSQVVIADAPPSPAVHAGSRSVEARAAVSPEGSVIAASAHTAATEVAIDALFSKFTAPGSPGAAVGVYSSGRVIFSKGYGLADLESGTPITPRTPFHVASVSKQFAAFAIALLAREGKVDLDADVRTYLPYFPDFGHKISTRQMIQHTSGLRDQWTLFMLGGRDMRDLLRQEQVVEMVKRQRALEFVPGTRFEYSNTGYALLAEIVHAVTGKTLRQFTTERMFQPLGMEHTFFYDDVREVVPGRANSYERAGNGPWLRSLLNYQTVGATSLFTNIEDLAHWAGNFSKPRVGDAALIKQISSSGVLNDGRPIHYGFGLFDQPLGGRNTVYHSGSDAMFLTYFVYYPEHDFAIALLANTDMDLPGKIAAIADLYLPPRPPAVQQEPDVVVAPVAAQLDKLAGTYLNPGHRAVRLERRGNRLVGWERHVKDSAEVVFRADGTFDLGERRRHYYRPVRTGQADIIALERVPVSDSPSQRFERVIPVVQGVNDLARLIGDYRSDELDITYTFSIQQGHLSARALWLAEPIRLVQITADHFDSENFRPDTVVFERNTRGEIIGAFIQSVHLRRVNESARSRSPAR